MKKNRKLPENASEYIENFSPPVKKRLKQMRAIIRKAAPKAEETISCGMPAYKQNGILVYFAAFTKHISLFPTASGIAAFESLLNKYKISKGTIQFSFDEPLPTELITRIVKFRVQENMKKKKSKIKMFGNK